MSGNVVAVCMKPPVWDRLPHFAYWLLPAAVGVPLTRWALVRNGALSGVVPDSPAATRRTETGE
jgi:hypothetical protein